MLRTRKNTSIQWKNGLRLAARLSTCILRTREAAFPILAVATTLREKWVLAYFKLTEQFSLRDQLPTAAAVPATRPFITPGRIPPIRANGQSVPIFQTTTTRAIRLLPCCQ